MDKIVYFENLGCAKNQVDAEVMAKLLVDDGWEISEEAENADLILVNTCGFIEIAKEESINTFLSLKQNYPKAKICLCGCLAQRYSNDLFDNLEEADGIFGNRDFRCVVDFTNRVMSGERVVLVPEYPSAEDECDTRYKLFSYPGSAFLKISEGCNHRCSYCAIPVIRGDLRSRPEKAVLAEAKRLVSTGVKELNVIGQDLAAYGTDWEDGKSHLVELLYKLCQIEGDFKIRLLYIHPDTFPMDLLDLMEKEEKILHYLDIPFQHASVSILSKMGRVGNLESYSEMIEYIKKRIPDVVLRTTIMLGFPGDSAEKFDEVVSFVNRCQFDWLGAFIYSREEDTVAYDMINDKNYEKLAKQAEIFKNKLETIQEKITQKQLNRFIGKKVDVLIEEKIEGEDLFIGRFYGQAPEVDGLVTVMGINLIPGQTVRCGITAVRGVDLEAVVVEN